MSQDQLQLYRAQIQITEELLWEIFPNVNPNRGRANKAANIKGFVYTFNKYADYYAIDTVLEVCHFIAQVAHESDQFNAYEEYASGKAYNGRADLGNIFAGDGERFKGRGPIQTTGRKNYTTTGRRFLELPFLTPQERKLFEDDGILKNPKLLQDPVWGTLAAFDYWVDRGLNSLCQPDNVKVSIKRLVGGKWGNYLYSPIEAITRKVNGGVNGLADREKKFKQLRKIFK